MSAESKRAWRAKEANRAKENAARRRNPEAEDALPPFAPANVEGPSGMYAQTPTPHLAQGLELRGQTVLIDGKNDLRARYDMGRQGLGPAPNIPAGLLPKRMTVHVRGDGKEYGRHVRFAPGEVERWEAFMTAVKEGVAPLEPLAPVPAPAVVDSDYLGVLNVGDEHLGMLAWGPEAGSHHDLTIAVRDLRVASRTLIDRAPPCARFVIVNQGDLFHAQDDNQRTPRSGHKLDVDGRFAKVFKAAVALVRDMIDHALTRFGHVRYIGIPGNHDPQTPFLVAEMLAAWYRDDPRVEIDEATAPFAFEEFGANLLGFAHGPSVTKIEKLPGIMVNDMAAAWGRTTKREWHIGDIHHVTAREFAGVTVWSHGILPPKDAWTNASGYRSEQRITQTTFHRKYGRRNMQTLFLDEVRDIIAAGGQP